MKKEFNKEHPYACVRFTKKKGSINKTLTSKFGFAMLNMWALQNTTETTNSLVFDLKTGDIISFYEGTEDGFPLAHDARKITIDPPNIEDWCPNLLQTLKADK